MLFEKNINHTRDSPGSDNFDVGLQAIKGEFKADLVVSFACATMGNEAGVERVEIRLCDSIVRTHSQPS